jgi:cyclic-di-AMP phosphodiesterase PgpH
VDAIEAGARTVDVPDKDAFNDLVRRIVFSKLSQGQLDETGLSLGNLRVVVNTLVDALVNMYHARIKYPWQTQTGDTEARRSSAPPSPETPPKTLEEQAAPADARAQNEQPADNAEMPAGDTILVSPDEADDDEKIGVKLTTAPPSSPAESKDDPPAE